MKIALGIIARNEADNIGETIRRLRGQDLIERGHDITIIVVANGCTDDTAEVSRQALTVFEGSGVASIVNDTPVGGKSRSWNLLVHEIADKATDVFIFLDADVELAENWALFEVVDKLVATPSAKVCSGRALKDIAKKPNKNVIDRFSLRVSSDTANKNTISGGLYAGWGDALRTIWLPEPTPGEDGFLNAMIQTNRFMEAADPEAVCKTDRVTHYFESHTVRGFFRHETRMLVGTAVNTWLFEHFASQPSTDAGAMIGELNKTPGWVGQVVRKRVAERDWFAIPMRVPLNRFHIPVGTPLMKKLRRYPVVMLATLLDVVPYIRANRIIKNQDAAGFW